MGGWINQALGQVPDWLTLDRFLVIVGAFLVWLQLRQGNRQHRREAQRDARQHAVEFSKFDRPGLQDAWDFVKANFKDLTPPRGTAPSPFSLRRLRDMGFLFPPDKLPGGSGEAVTEPSASEQNPRNPKSGRQLIDELDSALNYLEHLAMLVYARATDEDMAFEVIGSRLVTWGTRFREYIHECQKVNPRQFEHLPYLVDRWWRRLAKESYWDKQPEKAEHLRKPLSKPRFVKELEWKELQRSMLWVAGGAVVIGLTVLVVITWWPRAG